MKITRIFCSESCWVGGFWRFCGTRATICLMLRAKVACENCKCHYTLLDDSVTDRPSRLPVMAVVPPTDFPNSFAAPRLLVKNVDFVNRHCILGMHPNETYFVVLRAPRNDSHRLDIGMLPIFLDLVRPSKRRISQTQDNRFEELRMMGLCRSERRRTSRAVLHGRRLCLHLGSTGSGGSPPTDRHERVRS